MRQVSATDHSPWNHEDTAYASLHDQLGFQEFSRAYLSEPCFLPGCGGVQLLAWRCRCQGTTELRLSTVNRKGGYYLCSGESMRRPWQSVLLHCASAEGCSDRHKHACLAIVPLPHAAVDRLAGHVPEFAVLAD